MQPVDQQHWTSPPAPAQAPPPARTWLIVLTAFLVELVTVAAVCNQGLTDNIGRFADGHSGEFIGQVAEASQVYAWRFTPKGSDPHHLVLSQFALLATLFVVTAVLVFALTRGAVTFGRAFLGVWLAVIVATDVGAVVRNLVADVNPGGVSRFTYALFAGPSGYNFVAGLILGLVAGLIAALVGVAARRPGDAVVAAPATRSEPERAEDTFATAQLPAYTPPPAPSPQAEPARSSAPATEATTQIPRVPPADDPNKTTVLPRTFPRPPDDEDLGHHPE